MIDCSTLLYTESRKRYPLGRDSLIGRRTDYPLLGNKPVQRNWKAVGGTGMYRLQEELFFPVPEYNMHHAYLL